MIAIILSDKSQKRIESGRFGSSISLSYRYAALKVRGCDPGDRVLRGIILADIYRTGSCPLFELKCFLSRKSISLERR